MNYESRKAELAIQRDWSEGELKYSTVSTER